MIKICAECKSEYPLTTEYFYLNKHSKDGFKTVCKKCCIEKAKQYYKNNKDKREEYLRNNRETILKKRKKYRKLNKETISTYNALYYKNNSESIRNNNKEWNKNNPQMNGLYLQRRRTRRLKQIASLTNEDWEKIKQHFNNRCAYCGKDLPLVKDHFIALSNGGEFTINNIIPSCSHCNGSKHNKDFFEWYSKQPQYSKQRELKILEYLNYNKNRTQQLALIV